LEGMGEAQMARGSHVLFRFKDVRLKPCLLFLACMAKGLVTLDGTNWLFSEGLEVHKHLKLVTKSTFRFPNQSARGFSLSAE
jgi:hypothetical protein